MSYTQEGQGFPDNHETHPQHTHGGGKKEKTSPTGRDFNTIYIISYIYFFLTLFAHFCHAFKMSQRPK